MIYLTSYCLKKLKKYDAAIDYAERLKIRDPRNIIYMLNLAEINLALGSVSKAEEIVEYLKTIDADNEKLLLLEAAIRNRKVV